MKAALLQHYDSFPQYRDTTLPKPDKNQQRITVKAAALKNFDRLATQAGFYARLKKLPAIVGSDGVGITEDGKRVYATGSSGMFAEKALISTTNFVEIPEGLDWATAAALPNAVLGAVMPLKLKGNIDKGATVLINGATGFTGEIATQMARYYGASTIVVTGRNQDRLRKLQTLGANLTLALDKPDFSAHLKKIQQTTPFDIVLDYLWGETAERLLTLLSQGPTHPTCFINLGNNAGDQIQLPAHLLRNAALKITGAGMGSYTTAEFHRLTREFIPEAYALAAQESLKVSLHKEPLHAIEKVWQARPTAGTRTVLLMD